MWRSNVLRLRKCSSARPIRHGLSARCYSSAGLPVSNDEYQRALFPLLNERWSPRMKTRPIGLAISGGVDSMALAALYSKARLGSPDYESLPEGHGLIVDHRVRPESTEEAKWVAEQLLKKFDMKSTILSLEWPAGFDINDHKRFETDARMLRYQALGRACRDKDIAYLMVAHHADDQAETVMMRLMNNRLRSGLQAMHTVEYIPECYGLYGVHHSGEQQELEASWNIPFPIEQGGVQILRPLLGFEKSRLIATCESEGVAWAEDKTNQVQTYTSRNAIRHVYRNHTLPEALSIKSLVKVSLDMQKRIEAHKTYARELLDKCLINLDIQTASMVIRLPSYESLLDRRIETTSHINEARNNAYHLLKRIADLVTPGTKAPISQLSATIENIWPEFRDGEATISTVTESSQAEKNYCVYGIWWRWWGKPSPFEENAVSNWGFALQPHHPREWLLTRQQPSKKSKDKPVDQFVYAPAGSADLPGDSTYQLFDGRWWIRLQNRTNDTLILRLFDHKDTRYTPSVQDARGQPGPRPERFITTALAQLKPTDLRFTLPAVFRVDSTTGAESLVGFPTLDVSMNTLGAPTDVCEWSVRYKKIDTGSRNVDEVVVPGITQTAVQDEVSRQARFHAAQQRRMGAGAPKTVRAKTSSRDDRKKPSRAPETVRMKASKSGDRKKTHRGPHKDASAEHTESFWGTRL